MTAQEWAELRHEAAVRRIRAAGGPPPPRSLLAAERFAPPPPVPPAGGGWGPRAQPPPPRAHGPRSGPTPAITVPRGTSSRAAGDGAALIVFGPSESLD